MSISNNYHKPDAFCILQCLLCLYAVPAVFYVSAHCFLILLPFFSVAGNHRWDYGFDHRFLLGGITWLVLLLSHRVIKRSLARELIAYYGLSELWGYRPEKKLENAE